jgi:two-component system sensor histidine kinase DegS
VFGELERTIRHAITETRAVMVDLRPASLHQMGLIAALNQYARQFEARTGIRTQIRLEGPERRLPTVVESSFYRIVQEALTNVWKHAGAREARVEVELKDFACTLEIADDGEGFDPERALEEAGQHLGMSSLRDRAELVGGQFSVTSAPGEGTRIRVTVPFSD